MVTSTACLLHAVDFPTFPALPFCFILLLVDDGLRFRLGWLLQVRGSGQLALVFWLLTLIVMLWHWLILSGTRIDHLYCFGVDYVRIVGCSDFFCVGGTTSL